ncbi:carbon storage regulator [Aquipseudomonas alcaligenes]|uniref:Carbon storage regulator, CsrA n=1 Tax=Aquipseudomonas alcaligenes TaxID=43263 RepID=A0A1N6S7L4_AQUAC|nr:carbon storage regulator [Pseudomonas alcaligenes]SIQ36946.1 carbon storage regulator, CsrA [Pseudomonas alcaligenes]
MGLTVTRRVGESVILEVAEGTTPQELWEALQGGISVRLVVSQNTRARLDFNVPQLLRIAREELVEADLD